MSVGIFAQSLVAQNENLRSPVARVRWLVLKTEQRVSSGGETETTKTIAPLLLGAAQYVRID